MNEISYALGLGIGQQLKGMGGESLVIDDLAAAIKDVLAGNQPQIDPEKAQSIVGAFLKEQEQKEQEMQAQKGKVAKEAGEKFLAENKQNPNVITLPSGLQYEVIQEGTGRKPKATDQVKCHYEGTLIDGKVFDSSYKRNQPATFPLNGVIAGWTEGVQLMSEGAKYRFYIPYALAYGTRGAGAMIPPFAALIFDVELIEVL